MSDLIDRQAAIDESFEIYMDGQKFEVVQVETLMGLPSAQPQSTMGQVNDTAQSTKDCISRQAAIIALCKAGCDSGYCGVSCDDVKAIENLPSAQPECKQECMPMYANVSDTISRQAAIDGKITVIISGQAIEAIPVSYIKKLPPAQPYTDAEIQKLQDLVVAKFEKMYQLGYEEGKQAAQPEYTEQDVRDAFNDGYRCGMESAQPQRMKGRWVNLQCTQCGQVDTTKPNFCPNCGADMRGDEDE